MVEPVNLIAEIKPLVASGQLDNRPRHFPFVQGQILQGRVDAQLAPHQFTLTVQGEQLLAESNLQLQVGQNIRAEVVTLTPQLQLQLLPRDAITPRISSGIHLLGQQQELAPQFSALATQAQQSPELSPETRQTLQAFGNNLSTLPAVATPLPAIPELIMQGLTVLGHDNAALSQQQLQAMVTQLRHLASVLPEPQREQARQLADLLHNGQSLPSPGVQTSTAGTALPAPLLWDVLRLSLEQIAPGVQPLLQQLPVLPQQITDTPTTRLVQQLFTWLANLPSSVAPSQTTGEFSAQLQQTWQRLGLNLEQLLVQEKSEAATHTAKFALLEFAQQASVDKDSAAQAHSLVKSIEMYQLVQIRLATEEMQFLPLPFSFLQQGFVLIDADGKKQPSQDSSGEERQHLRLHLQLEGLGNLAIDIQQQGKAISLKFQAQNIERAQFIGTYRQELEQWLTSGTLQSVQFSAGAEEPAKVLLKRMMPEGTGMVNTKA